MATLQMHMGVRSQLKTTFREKTFLILSLALFLSWAVSVRFSNLLFDKSDSVVSSNTYSLAVASALLCGMVVLNVLAARWDVPRVGFILVAMASICACISTLLPLLGNPLAVYAVAGGLAGTTCALLVIVGVTLFSQLGFGESSRVFTIAFIVSVVFFLLLSWLASVTALSYVCAALPLLASISFYRSLRRSELPALLGGESSRRVPKGSDGPSPSLYVFLFLSAFLVFYMLTMFPKTTNYANTYYDSSLGSTSWISVGALLLTSLLSVFLLVLFERRKVNTFLTVFLGVTLFAAIYYFLPSMSTSALPFLFMTPCAIVSLFISLCGFLQICLAARDTSNVRRTSARGLLVMATAGFMASLFSAIFLGPLYGTISLQDALFVLIPAALMIAIVAMAVVVRQELLGVFFPDIRFTSELDTSSLENRCHLLATTYRLTTREEEVLTLLSEGRNEPYLQEHLTISRATVKTHIAHIYQKAGVCSRQELLDLLRQQG